MYVNMYLCVYMYWNMQALAAMMMDMSDDEDEDVDTHTAEASAMHSSGAVGGGERETEGAGKLFAEADQSLPTQCVLCHEGGSCTGKGGKPLGIIALMQVWSLKTHPVRTKERTLDNWPLLGENLCSEQRFQTVPVYN